MIGRQTMLHRAPKVVLMSDPRVGDVPLQDCGEDLVDTRDAITATECEDGDCWYTSSRWVRSSVRDRLVHAEQLLSPAYTLALDEGWRPPAIQARVFDRNVSRLAGLYPNEPLESLRRLASRFVAPPDVAPHPTGAAVDVVLLGRDGAEVDMGCAINTNPEDSAGLCYTDHPDVPDAARGARAALGEAMRRAGFVNYPTEWWHWSYGDRYWAMTTGASHARYGPAELPPRAGGEPASGSGRG
jgi:zinc D-Ala-D-Ala dipeptidase